MDMPVSEKLGVDVGQESHDSIVVLPIKKRRYMFVSQQSHHSIVVLPIKRRRYMFVQSPSPPSHLSSISEPEILVSSVVTDNRFSLGNGTGCFTDRNADLSNKNSLNLPPSAFTSSSVEGMAFKGELIPENESAFQQAPQNSGFLFSQKEPFRQPLGEEMIEAKPIMSNKHESIRTSGNTELLLDLKDEPLGLLLEGQRSGGSCQDQKLYWSPQEPIGVKMSEGKPIMNNKFESMRISGNTELLGALKEKPLGLQIDRSGGGSCQEQNKLNRNHMKSVNLKSIKSELVESSQLGCLKAGEGRTSCHMEPHKLILEMPISRVVAMRANETSTSALDLVSESLVTNATEPIVSDYMLDAAKTANPAVAIPKSPASLSVMSCLDSSAISGVTELDDDEKINTPADIHEDNPYDSDCVPYGSLTVGTVVRKVNDDDKDNDRDYEDGEVREPLVHGNPVKVIFDVGEMAGSGDGENKEADGSGAPRYIGITISENDECKGRKTENPDEKANNDNNAGHDKAHCIVKKVQRNNTVLLFKKPSDTVVSAAGSGKKRSIKKDTESVVASSSCETAKVDSLKVIGNTKYGCSGQGESSLKGIVRKFNQVSNSSPETVTNYGKQDGAKGLKLFGVGYSKIAKIKPVKVNEDSGDVMNGIGQSRIINFSQVSNGTLSGRRIPIPGESLESRTKRGRFLCASLLRKSPCEREEHLQMVHGPPRITSPERCISRGDGDTVLLRCEEKLMRDLPDDAMHPRSSGYQPQYQKMHSPFIRRDRSFRPSIQRHVSFCVSQNSSRSPSRSRTRSPCVWPSPRVSASQFDGHAELLLCRSPPNLRGERAGSPYQRPFSGEARMVRQHVSPPHTSQLPKDLRKMGPSRHQLGHFISNRSLSDRILQRSTRRFDVINTREMLEGEYFGMSHSGKFSERAIDDCVGESRKFSERCKPIHSFKPHYVGVDDKGFYYHEDIPRHHRFCPEDDGVICESSQRDLEAHIYNQLGNLRRPRRMDKEKDDEGGCSFKDAVRRKRGRLQKPLLEMG